MKSLCVLASISRTLKEKTTYRLEKGVDHGEDGLYPCCESQKLLNRVPEGVEVGKVRPKEEKVRDLRLSTASDNQQRQEVQGRCCGVGGDERRTFVVKL